MKIKKLRIPDGWEAVSIVDGEVLLMEKGQKIDYLTTERIIESGNGCKLHPEVYKFIEEKRKRNKIVSTAREDSREKLLLKGDWVLIVNSSNRVKLLSQGDLCMVDEFQILSTGSEICFRFSENKRRYFSRNLEYIRITDKELELLESYGCTIKTERA